MRFPLALLLCLVPLLSAADAVLTVEGVTGRDGVVVPALQLKGSDLAAMPRTKVTLKMDGSDHLFEGVLVYEVLKKAGQPFGDQLRKSQLVKYAICTAHDGYRALFALPEFDPAFTAATAMIADRMDGQPLPDKKGPLRLIVPGEKTASRSIYMLERIELQSAPEPLR